VKESTDLSFHLVLFFCFELKLADQVHQFVPVEISFFRKFSSQWLKNLTAKIREMEGYCSLDFS